VVKLRAERPPLAPCSRERIGLARLQPSGDPRRLKTPIGAVIHGDGIARWRWLPADGEPLLEEIHLACGLGHLPRA